MSEVLTANGKRIGRPSIKNQELLDSICNRIAVGESLRSICNDEDSPHITTVCAWLNEDQIFSKQYARARERQADYFADEVIEISNEAVDRDTAQAAKVKIDARIWHASKTNRTKWADTPAKTEVNVSTAVVVLDPSKQAELQDRRKQAEEQLQLKDKS